MQLVKLGVWLQLNFVGCHGEEEILPRAATDVTPQYTETIKSQLARPMAVYRSKSTCVLTVPDGSAGGQPWKALGS